MFMVEMLKENVDSYLILTDKANSTQEKQLVCKYGIAIILACLDELS